MLSLGATPPHSLPHRPSLTYQRSNFPTWGPAPATLTHRPETWQPRPGIRHHRTDQHDSPCVEGKARLHLGARPPSPCIASCRDGRVLNACANTLSNAAPRTERLLWLLRCEFGSLRCRCGCRTVKLGAGTRRHETLSLSSIPATACCLQRKRSGRRYARAARQLAEHDCMD